jgi:hypothetical protein
VELRLLTVLLVQQPKVLVRGKILAKRNEAAALELVWDPLVGAVEAVPCPVCGRPTYAFAWTRQGRLVCPTCAATTPVRPVRRHL